MMEDFRYQLQVYKGISTRHTCPQCGHKGEFVLYIDTKTGQPLHPSVGRCERRLKCGYEYKPHEFFKDNPDAKPKDDWKPTYVKPLPQSVPKTDYLPAQYIPTMKQMENNNLFRFFCSKFGEAKSREVFEKYKIGTSKHWRNNDGLSTVFPQIDTNGNLRQIKVIAYNPDSGRRLHKEHFAEKLTSKGYVSDTMQDKVWFAGKSLLCNFDANLVQCFFGEHLLKTGNDVSIVESEKTAMIASLYLPNSIWLATGGKNGSRWTSSDVCKVLTGKNVFLYPDLKCLQEWTEKAEILKSHGIKVHVSRYLEEHATDEDKEKGFDIGDYLLQEEINTGPKQQASSSASQNNVLARVVPDIKTTTIGDICQWLSELGISKGRVTFNV